MMLTNFRGYYASDPVNQPIDGWRIETLNLERRWWTGKKLTGNQHRQAGKAERCNSHRGFRSQQTGDQHGYRRYQPARVSQHAVQTNVLKDQ